MKFSSALLKSLRFSRTFRSRMVVVKIPPCRESEPGREKIN